MSDLHCPICRKKMDAPEVDVRVCIQDGLRFPREDGVWRCLLEMDERFYRGFLKDYQAVRKAEKRGSADPEFYRRLPFEDRSRVMPEMWRMRSASYRTLQRRVLSALSDRPAAALDLGSGNGWLAYRLAKQGFETDAVDLLANDWDGLGVHRHYDISFRPIQASFDHLPLAPESYDLIVFNASLHYSVEYGHTLEHALGFLKPNGSLIIMDTPFYRRAASGIAMVREREQDFLERYGFRSNALPMENFLTDGRLEVLAEVLGLEVVRRSPWFGWRRLLTPLAARLRGRREPARFPLVVLKREV